ncbi:MAG: nucleotidyl transferase AbiEii/AbiGii toxin family protein [Verrucomicrobiales bacterium]
MNDCVAIRANRAQVFDGIDSCALFVQSDQIKMELDTDPPAGAETEVRTLLLPIPFQVKLFAPSCLFAGKMHALLCRDWKGRVKGRDFHDFVWYLGKGIPVHLAHLRKRMEQTGHWKEDEVLTGETLKVLLRDRFAEVDFEQAKDDVLPFIQDADAVALWGEEFFAGLADRLTVE